ncbi:ABC transporter ATP-binding protein [Dactylosporangium sp. NPDC051485]|uniref:ABC transporter ATP-binding protein n=1 Tax=Dactylosporangium sp. NPDC051485 TaxID=3154846 RepID=UPI00342D578C
MTIDMTTAPDLLDVRGLSVEFPARGGGWVGAISDVSLRVRQGESVGLVGESGSGKTVTSLAVMGLTPLTGGRIAAGSIAFDGRELTSLPQREWRALRGGGIGMIFQQPTRSLNPAFTVGDQIAESVRRHLGLSRRAARARAIEMLKLVEIPRAESRMDDYPHALSGGMCQRVMIAMVMATNPRLLVADEPTTALDVTVQERILALLRDLQEQTGVALLFVSHDLAVVADLCERVVVMYAGEIIEDGTAGDVFYQPQHPYSAGLLASIPNPRRGIGNRLASIPGQVPSAGTWPPGCRFQARCGFAVPGVCDAAHPPLLPSPAGSLSRCVRAAEIALEGVAAG